MKSPLSSLLSRFGFASSWFELYAAFSTFMMLLRTVINDLVPKQVQSYIVSKLYGLFAKSKLNDQDQLSLKIDQYWNDTKTHNELYLAAQKYLPTLITHTYTSLRVGKLGNKSNNLLEFAVDGRQDVVDEFEGTVFTWRLCVEPQKISSDDDTKWMFSSEFSSEDEKKRAWELTFNKKYREKAIDKYIPHVLKTYEAMKIEERDVKIYSWNGGGWKPSVLSHPSTFETLALDPEMKQTIIHDVERFLKRKEFYKKVGKPWKRGYLLYGPPGTGKSSLIAALANYLKFDVYDIQLTSIQSDSTLKRLVCDTPKRSIVVIEDIDCNKEVHARSMDQDLLETPKLPRRFLPPRGMVNYMDGLPAPSMDYDVHEQRFSLSGMLNYMDGLWSGSGDEKIMIFTTNHKDRIDPALLRPGRMDMHINLSFLKAKAFRILASNYLDIEDHHPLFEQIEFLLEEKIEVTPAVVAEQLIRHEDPDIALDELLKFLKEMEKQREPKKSEDIHDFLG
ncbi:AAA-ATPase At3g50940-like [Lotus japonicus]|uniref:AAA-ATPase At3g50940-like n=1 Tax=Lotus japonicus TaxID=34305 RepID=UPI0025907710|nr:AAA-ATPase At3g50940-like [Lotus japonicus]